MKKFSIGMIILAIIAAIIGIKTILAFLKVAILAIVILVAAAVAFAIWFIFSNLRARLNDPTFVLNNPGR